MQRATLIYLVATTGLVLALPNSIKGPTAETSPPGPSTRIPMMFVHLNAKRLLFYQLHTNRHISQTSTIIVKPKEHHVPSSISSHLPLFASK
jgi:hypothetical protein